MKPRFKDGLELCRVCGDNYQQHSSGRCHKCRVFSCKHGHHFRLERAPRGCPKCVPPLKESLRGIEGGLIYAG